ncbi:hypothetical protein K470DRAFT_267223 [Piedraia hortae CBS 480.64]|uniref:Uncharacterized protein n=1 Tax=Piedraia hortae CBS 480.64 TaxID=1314780 RepID=A0A6A7CBS6_9PEZI|nr:hypothetical protein K470DRAFT_267223 [Piedraia hortae CBS 480.64]
MSSRAGKALREFIDNFPDDKLTYLPEQGTVFKNQDYRLDVQGLADEGKSYNVQVQINSGTKISTISRIVKSKKSATTVAMVLVPKDGSMEPDEIRKKLLLSTRHYTINAIKSSDIEKSEESHKNG